MRSGSSANRFSRPLRTLRTTPAPSNTRRCLVTAWRVRSVPSVRREIDCGSPALSRASTDSRVASPSAANTNARAFSALARAPPEDALSRRLPDMLFDILHLHSPAGVVHAQCLVAAFCRDSVEARFDHAQQGPGRGLLQRKLDQCRLLAGIVVALVLRVGMPGEREQPLGLHLLDHRLPAILLMARIGDLPARDLAWHERPLQPHAEPATEFAMISQRPPDPGHRGLEFDGFFEAIGHMQPPGCSLS